MRNCTLGGIELNTLNNEEIKELESQGFGHVKFKLSNQRPRIEFYMRIHRKKDKSVLISPDDFKNILSPTLHAKFKHAKPDNKNIINTFYHKSLINLTDYLIRETGIKEVEIENERIEGRPDIWFQNPLGLDCVIEVESGSREGHVEDLKIKIEKLNNLYLDRWFIVVPSQKIRDHYEKKLNMNGRVIIKTELEKNIKILNTIYLKE